MAPSIVCAARPYYDESTMVTDLRAATVRNKTLVLDLVEWVARGEKPYAEVMEAWRTSCPRFSVWEDAVELGLVVRVCENGAPPMVRVTEVGLEFLQAERPA
jgi:hypothetical protein